MDSRRLLEAALKEQVAFVPGDSFFAPDTPAEKAARYLRLNFSNANPDKIREGIRRLGAVVKARLDTLT